MTLTPSPAGTPCQAQFYTWSQMKPLCSNLLTEILHRPVSAWPIRNPIVDCWNLKFIERPMSHDELDAVLVALQVADHEHTAHECRQDPIWNLPSWLSEELAMLAVPFPVEASHAADYGVWFTSSAMTYAVGIVRRRIESQQVEQYCSTYLINADKLPTPSAEACEAYLRMVIDKFLLSEKGKQAYEKTCQDFNWGDVETEIPKDFWATFGITPCDDGRPFLGCGIIAILVDQDELLGKNLYD